MAGFSPAITTLGSCAPRRAPFRMPISTSPAEWFQADCLCGSRRDQYPCPISDPAAMAASRNPSSSARARQSSPCAALSAADQFSLVCHYLNQRLPCYFIRAAHILIAIDIEPTTKPACHSIFADKCLASDLHNSPEWEQRWTGYRIAPPTDIHS